MHWDIKRSPVKKKIFSRQKWFLKLHFKNVDFTFKSLILKCDKQQKELNKKKSEKYIYMLRIFLIVMKREKLAKTLNFKIRLF